MFDLILPCYNPPQNWHWKVLENYQKLCELLPDTHINLFIVNDGSTQKIDTDAIDFLQTHIPTFYYLEYPENQGKGHALRFAISKTKSDLQIYTDLDFPYQLSSIVNMYHSLQKDNVDVVTGIRDDAYYERIPYKRKLTSKFSQILNYWLLNLPLKDTQSGLKGFNAFGKEVFLSTEVKEFLFDTEFLALAHKSHLQIEIIPLSLRPEITLSKMRYKVLLRELYNFYKIWLRINFRKDKNVLNKTKRKFLKVIDGGNK